MNDRDLKTLLASVVPPPIDETARDRALHRATLAFSRPADAAREPASRRAAYGWAAVCAILLVAGLAAVRPFRSVPEGGRLDASALAQVEALFPGQLNAVIERDGEVSLDLAGQPSPAANEQPVLVQFERGGRRLRVLSYSGRSVTLELKDGRVTFEALVTGEGGVVLSGDDFVWNSAHPAPLAGYRVNARPLRSL